LNNPRSIPEYSIKAPVEISPSASARSKGTRPSFP